MFVPAGIQTPVRAARSLVSLQTTKLQGDNIKVVLSKYDRREWMVLIWLWIRISDWLLQTR